MLQPKKTKFRRCQKGRIKGNAQRYILEQFYLTMHVSTHL